MSTATAAPQPGAHWDGAGVRFALFSSAASAVELCLFDTAGHELSRHALPHRDGDIFHGYLPDCVPGQHYGYRVHGEFAPDRGLWCNPHKLLIDPYARQLSGPVIASEVLRAAAGTTDPLRPDTRDSARLVPRGIVQGETSAHPRPGPQIPWADTIIYEANVRGYTMRHPDLTDAERGRFRGMANGRILEYLKALGITAIELLPVHAFTDEEFLIERGLRNYWGYNTLSFFAPETRYLAGDDIGEFREMVDAIHDAGIEVILDVVYNHTAEGGVHGPTMSFRGIDNLAYYRTLPDDPGVYINDTGCGNTLNVDHPAVQTMICDSLRYWAQDMGVDGFRFDLCTVLGRRAGGFDPAHPLLRRIEHDPLLRDAKLIAEPWDVGPGGYQLGHFSERWSEWNDQFRDSLRRFWRGDHGEAAEFARRLHGSSDYFEASGREPRSSINFVTSHDGYTLADLVSYEHRHNEANGENNRDGHAHNFSANYGVEGNSDDPGIQATRHRQRLNLLASVLFAQGTPMILAGDEFGNSQNGNNNAYAQDNETGWLDWEQLAADPVFAGQVRTLIRLRRTHPLLRQSTYRHGNEKSSRGHDDIEWLSAAGTPLSAADWRHTQALQLLFHHVESIEVAEDDAYAIALLVNAHHDTVDFSLPAIDGQAEWRCVFARAAAAQLGTGSWQLSDRSSALFVFPR